MKKIIRALALAGAMLATGAAPVQAQAPSIGIIDEDKLAQGYTRYREALVNLDKQAQELDAKLVAREFLDIKSTPRFDELVLKEQRSAAEQTELDTLVKTGNGRYAEQLGLIGKVDRTPADTKRLEELAGLSQVNAPGLTGVQNRLYESIKKRQTKIDDENTDRANTVIQQVAADKKLALVWRKRAVIWHAASIDITNEILTRLNKG